MSNLDDISRSAIYHIVLSFLALPASKQWEIAKRMGYTGLRSGWSNYENAKVFLLWARRSDLLDALYDELQQEKTP